MRGNVPAIYWTFRTAWTVLHFVLVLAATALLLSWALRNGNGEHLFHSATDRVQEFHDKVANSIPWPWS